MVGGGVWNLPARLSRPPTPVREGALAWGCRAVPLQAPPTPQTLRQAILGTSNPGRLEAQLGPRLGGRSAGGRGWSWRG